MKIGLVTFATDSILSWANASLHNKQTYCNEHGYALINYCINHSDRPAAWTKIRQLQEQLAQFDFLFWSDADSIITNREIPIEHFIDPNADLIISRDHNGLNSGQFLIRNCNWSHAFLKEVWNQDDLIHHEWHEQAAIIRLFPNHSQHIKVLPQHYFNSYEDTWKYTDFLIHFAGTTTELRRDRVPLFAGISNAIADKSIFAIQDRTMFADLLNCLGLLGQAVEVGVREGSFAEQFRLGWDGDTLHLVDSWKHLADYIDNCNVSDQEHERIYETAIHRMSKFGGAVRIHRALSQEASHLFADRSLDFVYLDANHATSAVRTDIDSWYRKVQCGGIIAGHDYIDGSFPEGHFGVKLAVDEFAQSRGSTIYQTYEPDWPSWFLVKPWSLNEKCVAI